MPPPAFGDKVKLTYVKEVLNSSVSESFGEVADGNVVGIPWVWRRFCVLSGCDAELISLVMSIVLDFGCNVMNSVDLVLLELVGNIDGSKVEVS